MVAEASRAAKVERSLPVAGEFSRVGASPLFSLKLPGMGEIFFLSGLSVATLALVAVAAVRGRKIQPSVPRAATAAIPASPTWTFRFVNPPATVFSFDTMSEDSVFGSFLSEL